MSDGGSRAAATAAIKLAITASREEENSIRSFLKKEGIKTAAIDYGGEFQMSVAKILERAVVAAKR